MDQEEIKELVKANLELSKDNNKMLKKIRGVHKRALIFNVIKWAFLIIIATGLIYYLSPFLSKITEFYNAIPLLKDIDLNSLIKQVQP